MLRALWFLLRLSLLVAGIVWVAQYPGHVEIEWRGYLVETSVGFLATVLAGFLFAWTVFYRLYRAFVSVPDAFRRYRISANREKGYLAVTQGLVAVAAGDAHAADKFAQRAESIIPGTALTKLLVAQTSLMNGNAPKARRVFADLLEDEHAAMFGLRGLLNETLQAENYAEALQYARQALKLQPKRIWVIRTLFDLETRNRDWIKAVETLERGTKLKVFDAKTSIAHRQALLAARAEEEMRQGDIKKAIKLADKSWALDRSFIPPALLLVRLYTQANKNRAALKTIEKAWAANPHPDLSEVWMRHRPPARKARSIYEEGKELYAWARPLYDMHPQHHHSHQLLGRAALEARMWREAREHLKKAEDYRGLARLERAETGNEAKAREWLEIAADAPPEPKWVCHTCGHAALDWNALCRQCTGFNTYGWMIPGTEGHTPVRHAVGFDAGLIAPPR